VEAFHGDGNAVARYVLYQKLAPGFRKIMTNTADSPRMEIFRLMSASKNPATGEPEQDMTKPAEKP